jgi:hypothetical protein
MGERIFGWQNDENSPTATTPQAGLRRRLWHGRLFPQSHDPRFAYLSVGRSLYTLSPSKWLPNSTERSDITHTKDVRSVFPRKRE